MNEDLLKVEDIKKEVKDIKKNICFIDGQNLHGSSKENGWSVDYKKLGIYLKENYNVENIYYFVGYKKSELEKLYLKIEKSGFELIFKPHNQNQKSEKKGNVDSDIIFESMKNIIINIDLDKIIIISGDGDYFNLVNFLISQDRFEKILFPNKKFASSLYKKLGSEFFDYIENLKLYIEKIPEAKNGIINSNEKGS